MAIAITANSLPQDDSTNADAKKPAMQRAIETANFTPSVFMLILPPRLLVRPSIKRDALTEAR